MVSQRLVGAVPPQDLVCRLGGDEFAVLLAEDAGITACVTPHPGGPGDPRRHRRGGGSGSARAWRASTAVEGPDLDALLRTADSRMYLDKDVRRTPVPRSGDDPQVVTEASGDRRDGVRQVIQLALGRNEGGVRRRG